MLAEVNASATCQNNPATQNGVGFLSPLLYPVASNPTAYAASFNDIKAGNNDPYGDSNLFQATSGDHMASGLGTPQLTQPDGGAGLAFDVPLMCISLSAWSLMAATTSGWQWPVAVTAMPAVKSRNRLPSTSSMTAPLPRSTTSG